MSITAGGSVTIIANGKVKIGNGSSVVSGSTVSISAGMGVDVGEHAMVQAPERVGISSTEGAIEVGMFANVSSDGDTLLSAPIIRNYGTVRGGRSLTAISLANENLFELICKRSCDCLNGYFDPIALNEKSMFTAKSNPDDPQLLLHIPFTQTARLCSLLMEIPGNTSCPKHIKVFVNKTCMMSFDDAAGNNNYICPDK